MKMKNHEHLHTHRLGKRMLTAHINTLNIKLCAHQMSLLFGWMSPNSAKDYTKEKKPKVLKSKKEKDKKKIATRTPNLQQQQMRKYTHRISHDIFHICFYFWNRMHMCFRIRAFIFPFALFHLPCSNLMCCRDTRISTKR